MASSATSLREGMGAIVHEDGTTFRAPHADRVAVVGTFNDWSPDRHVLEPEGNGCFALDVPEARSGHEDRSEIVNGDLRLWRIDPHARSVTNSVGNGIITDCTFEWGNDSFTQRPHNELVIYELHIGTFRLAASAFVTLPSYSVLVRSQNAVED